MSFDRDLIPKCWFLCGPTACGKTSLGVALAEQIGAEIVSLDSMALYYRMDIGTAKPSRTQRERVPHHLLGIIEPHQEFSAAHYLAAAEVSVQSILDTHRIPLFVGGTGLYLRSILRGLFEGPEADWAFRRQLEDEAARHPPGELHRRLEEVDMETADRLHPNDDRRVIRALEVYHLTGQKMSDLQDAEPLPTEDRPACCVWLSPPRDWLYEHINERVLQMIDAGWVDEVRALLERVPKMGRSARQALGYQELIAHIEGQSTLEEAIAETQTRTRQFAKRQHTWFRNLDECTEVPMTGDESADELVRQVIAHSRED